MSKARILKFEFIKDETGYVKYIEAAGPSDAAKPTENIASGSLFHETDTKKIYAFEESTGEWIEQMKLSEDEDTVSTMSFSASPAVTRPSLQLNGGLEMNNALDLPDAEPEEIREEIPEDEIQEEPEEEEEIQEEAEEEPGDAE